MFLYIQRNLFECTYMRIFFLFMHFSHPRQLTNVARMAAREYNNINGLIHKMLVKMIYHMVPNIDGIQWDKIKIRNNLRRMEHQCVIRVYIPNKQKPSTIPSRNTISSCTCSGLAVRVSASLCLFGPCILSPNRPTICHHVKNQQHASFISYLIVGLKESSTAVDQVSYSKSTNHSIYK